MKQFEIGELADWPLTRAAREVNAYADTHGMPETCEHFGVDLDKLMYLAHQRALRAVFALDGINMDADVPLVPILTPQQRELVKALTMSEADGIMIGWVGRQFADEEDQSA